MRSPMLDLRPVGYAIGLILVAFGATMLVPMGLDLADGNPHGWVFLESGALTSAFGGFLALASANAARGRISLRQIFLLVTGIWLALPLFGALPFSLGAPGARPADAFFEAMSGVTTTGSTVFTGLDDLPRGILLWRSMLQWFGGIGIVISALAVMPELRVGGMQIFRAEAFDTAGKVLPRAVEIAREVTAIYVGLTLACALAFAGTGMPPFHAINHALATLSTGGFSTGDRSFADWQGSGEYAAALFMVLASLPFARYVQVVSGEFRPLWRDSQARAFLGVVGATVGFLALYRVVALDENIEKSLREALFNGISVITGTGFASADYQTWGPPAIIVFFFVGLVGGCAGSTTCAIKIFRFQVLFASIAAQIRTIHTPHGVFLPRYDGAPIPEDTLLSVIAFFTAFLGTLGLSAALLAMTGLDFVTALSGAATTITNTGPGLGTIIGPTGTFQPLNDAAKWILSATMFVGRLELMVVFAVLTPRFWRAA